MSTRIALCVSFTYRFLSLTREAAEIASLCELKLAERFDRFVNDT